MSANYAFTNLGSLATSYKTLVVKHDMNIVPSIVAALDKLDANKVEAKRPALFEAALVVIHKWDDAWNRENQTVTDPKEKAARSLFAVEMYKLKQALHGDTTSSAPAAGPPYKKTTFGADFLKARAQVPLGAVAVALWELDKAATIAEARPLAAAAQKALETEVDEIEAEVKGAKDAERKAKLTAYLASVNKLLPAVKALAK